MRRRGITHLHNLSQAICPASLGIRFQDFRKLHCQSSGMERARADGLPGGKGVAVKTRGGGKRGGYMRNCHQCMYGRSSSTGFKPETPD